VTDLELSDEQRRQIYEEEKAKDASALIESARANLAESLRVSPPAGPSFWSEDRARAATGNVPEPAGLTGAEKQRILQEETFRAEVRNSMKSEGDRYADRVKTRMAKNVPIFRAFFFVGVAFMAFAGVLFYNFFLHLMGGGH
jgi:hypothetical protein